MGNNIFGTLNTAALGMNAQQAGLNVTSQNVANVNTEGYSRKLLALKSLPGPPTGGGGVVVSGVERYVDKFATSRLMEETSLFGDAKQRSEILSNVSELFNDLKDAGLGSAFDNFFGALRGLESSPGDATVRQEIIARADELASTFNRITNEMEAIRINIGSALKSSVSKVNMIAAEISKLNGEIGNLLVRQQDVSELLDRRDLMLEKLSEHVKVDYFEDNNSYLNIFLEDGFSLVEGTNCSQLQISDSMTPGSATVDYIASNGHVMDITSSLRDGRMGGALNVRDGVIPDIAGDLDELAYDMISSINAQHTAGFGLDGVSGRNLFEPVGAVAGAAGQMSLSSDVDGFPDGIAAALNSALLPGDNRNALELSALADQPLAAGGTVSFGEEYGNIVGKVGVQTRRAEDESSIRETSIGYVKDIKDSSTGVSLDEEMTNLIKYQRAYQASARVLSSIDEVIQVLVGLGGR